RPISVHEPQSNQTSKNKYRQPGTGHQSPLETHFVQRERSEPQCPARWCSSFRPEPLHKWLERFRSRHVRPCAENPYRFRICKRFCWLRDGVRENPPYFREGKQETLYNFDIYLRPCILKRKKTGRSIKSKLKSEGKLWFPVRRHNFPFWLQTAVSNF